jgi:hypothetical protein
LSAVLLEAPVAALQEVHDAHREPRAEQAGDDDLRLLGVRAGGQDVGRAADGAAEQGPHQVEQAIDRLVLDAVRGKQPDERGRGQERNGRAERHVAQHARWTALCR